MRTKTNHLLIGLFVLAGVVMIIGGVMALGGRAVFVQRIEIETYIAESVQGLDVGSPLRYRGVKIGQVQDIALVDNYYDTQHTYVLVRIGVRPEVFGAADESQLREELDARIGKGLRVRLALQGLTGVYYLEAEEVADPSLFEQLSYDWTPERPYVPSVPSTAARLTSSLVESLVKLQRSDVPGLVEEAKKTLASLRTVITDAEVKPLSRGAQDLMESGRELLDTTRKELDRVLRRSHDAVSRAEGFLARLVRSVDPEALRDAVRGLRDLTAEGDRSLAELRGVLAEGRRALRRLDGVVADQDRNLSLAFANLRRISEHLADLAAVLERYPSLLLFGEAPAPVRKR